MVDTVATIHDMDTEVEDMVGMEWEDMVVAVDMEDTDVEDMVDMEDTEDTEAADTVVATAWEEAGDVSSLLSIQITLFFLSDVSRRQTHLTLLLSLCCKSNI